MGWWWLSIFNILWNAFIHAISFNWRALEDDIDDLETWAKFLWSEVNDLVDDLEDWTKGRISYVSGYAFGLYVQAVNFVNDQVDAIYSVVDGWLDSLETWVSDSISWLSGYAFGLYVQALNWIDDQIDAVYSWVEPYVQSVIGWVQSWLGWIADYRELITDWLVNVQWVIDWLRYTAFPSLTAFLADPVGYVLGWLLSPVVNVVNWWNEYAVPLADFVSGELADLRTLLANGLAILNALVDNPEQFVFDALAPKFLTWFGQLLADNW